MNQLSTFFSIVLIVILGNNQSLFSQTCNWASHAGGTYDDIALVNAFDREGNYYVSGYTKSSQCYFQTDTVFNGVYLTSFLAKYNSMGKEEWVLNINSYNENYPEPFGGYIPGMTTDTILDQILITGIFYYWVKLPDTTLYATSKGGYVAKLNPEGHTIWATTIIPGVDGYGYGGNVYIFDVTIDSQSNIYVSGASNEETHFGNVIIPRGGFIAKYREDGTLVWAKQITQVNQYENPYSSEAPPLNLCFQGEQLYVNGKAIGTTIEIDTIVMELGSILGTFYLARFDANGNIQGVTFGGGRKIGAGDQIASDQSGNIYLTGIFLKPTGIFGHDTLYSEAIYGDCYITKINKNGEFIWTKQLFATGAAWGEGIAIDREGYIYLSIKFGGDIQCGEEVITSSPTEGDIALLKFSPDGDCLGYRHYSEGSVPMLSIDREGNIGMAGFFKNSLEIGGNLFTSYGEADVFAAKCAPITGLEEFQKNEQNQLLIYANPNTGKCNITIPDEFKNESDLTLQIYDLKGKLVQQSKVEPSEGNISLNIEAQAKGMYTAILSNGKKSYSGKIVFE